MVVQTSDALLLDQSHEFDSPVSPWVSRRNTLPGMTRFAYFCGHEQFHPETLVRHAVLAEEAGFDLVMISEHFHPWVDDVSASGFAFSTLGAIAVETSRVEIVTGVNLPLLVKLGSLQGRSMSLEELATGLTAAGQKSIRVASEFLHARASSSG